MRGDGKRSAVKDEPAEPAAARARALKGGGSGPVGTGPTGVADSGAAAVVAGLAGSAVAASDADDISWEVDERGSDGKYVMGAAMVGIPGCTIWA